MELRRPGSSRDRHMAEASLSEKVNQLPKDLQSSFQRMMTEVYEQEHNSMMSIIGDARRSLALTVDELHDEQQVLSLTADKINKTRLSSATRRRNPEPRPQTCRSGIVAARHQRVLSARKERQQATAADETDRQTSRPTTAAARRPITASTRPSTAVTGRPGSSTLPRIVSSSMDSVTFESERRRAQAERPSAMARTPSPPVSSRSTSAATPRTVHVVTIDDDDDYEEEKQLIMNRMSGAQTRVEEIRMRQTNKLRDRQEKKKAQHDREQHEADALCHEANALQELKLKDMERQSQLIKERIEERKRRKQQQQETSLGADGHHRGHRYRH